MQSLKKIIALLGLCFVFFGCIIQTQPSVPDTTPPANLRSVSYSFAANTDPNKTNITFSWINPSDSDYKSMEVYYLNGTEEVLQDTVDKPGTSLTLRGLALNRTFAFKFVSVDTTGNKSSGYTRSITTPAPEDTTPPAALTSVNTTTTVNSVTFSWTNPSDSDYASMKIFNGNTLVATVNKPTATYTVTGLNSNTTYTFKFVSVDTTGNESSGYTRSITTPATDTTPPAALTSVNTTTTVNSVTFSWTNPTDSDYASMKIYNGDTLVTTVNKPATTYTVTGLTQGTTYTFKFISVDTAGNESQSYQTTATPAPDTTPPANLTNITYSFSENSNPNKTNITFEWTNPTDSDYDKMKIYYRTQNQTTAEPIITAPNSFTRATLTGITIGTTYVFIFKSVDTAGNESSGYERTILAGSTDTTPPAALTNVTCTENTGTSVTFSWTNPSDSDYASMKIYNGNTFVATVNQPATTYTVTGLTGGTEYTFNFKSVDTSGNESSAYSKTVTTAIPVSSIALNKSLIILGKTESETLTATILPTNATNTNVTWTSSNSGISVSNNGTISATNAGVATITATVGGKSATATVLVLNTSSSFSYVHSDDLTTIPSGSFSGYITEDNDDDSPENGQIAYKFTSAGKIDLTGYDGEVYGAWLGSTYSNNGWTYKLNDSAISLDSNGKYSNGTVSLSVNPVIVKEGSGSNAVPYLLLVNALTNTGNTELTGQKLGCGADVDVAGEDETPVYITNSGVKSTNVSNKMVFLLDCLSGEGVTPVNTLYVGEWVNNNSVINNIYNDQETSITGTNTDSVIAYSWRNFTLNPGETRLFAVRLSLTQDKRGSLDAIVY